MTSFLARTLFCLSLSGLMPNISHAEVRISDRSMEAAQAAIFGYSAMEELALQNLPNGQRLFGYDHSKYSVNDETIELYLNGQLRSDLVVAQVLGERFQANTSSAITMSFDDFTRLLIKGDGVSFTDGRTHHISAFSHHDRTAGRWYFLDGDVDHFFLLLGKNDFGVDAQLEEEGTSIVSITDEEFRRVWRGGSMFLALSDIVQLLASEENYAVGIELLSKGRDADFLTVLQSEYRSFRAVPAEEASRSHVAAFYTAFLRVSLDGRRYRRLSDSEVAFAFSVMDDMITRYGNSGYEQEIKYVFFLEIFQLFRYEMPQLAEAVLPLADEALSRDPDDPIAGLYRLAALSRMGQPVELKEFEDALESMRQVFWQIDRRDRLNPVAELREAAGGSTPIARLYDDLFFSYHFVLENHLNAENWERLRFFADQMVSDFPNQWRPYYFASIAGLEKGNCEAIDEAVSNLERISVSDFGQADLIINQVLPDVDDMRSRCRG